MGTQQSLPFFRTSSQTRSVRGGRAAGEHPDAGALPLADSRGLQDYPQHNLIERTDINPHLVAARRLSRKIKKLPDHSEVQTRTGQAICQHLRLMLSEMPEAEPTARASRTPSRQH